MNVTFKCSFVTLLHAPAYGPYSFVKKLEHVSLLGYLSQDLVLVITSKTTAHFIICHTLRFSFALSPGSCNSFGMREFELICVAISPADALVSIH